MDGVDAVAKELCNTLLLLVIPTSLLLAPHLVQAQFSV
jgi:hypothetical protein